MKTLILGEFSFFGNDAGTQYVKGLAKVLQGCGFAPGFLVPSLDCVPGLRYAPAGEVDGFEYFSVHRRRLVGWRSALHKYASLGDECLLWLAQAPEGLFREVVTYSGPCARLLRLQSICRARGVRLTNIVVEWYDPRHYEWRKPCASFLAAVDCELQRRLVNRSLRRLVVISTYLESYYRHRGVDTVLIPPIVDLEDEKWKSCSLRWRPECGLRLVYAGSAGKKDLLVRVLKALATLRDVAPDVVLTILGTSRETATKALGDSSKVINALGNRVQFKGCLPHAEALREVATADFSVLVRPDARYANAGFPTKLVESLACGTPPILNLTSDIGQYVRDMREGIVLRDDSVQAVAEGLLRARKLSNETRADLRTRAQLRARLSFECRAHKDALAKFFAPNVMRKTRTRS